MTSVPSRLLRDIQSQPDSLDVVLTYQRGGRNALLEAARVLKHAKRVVITGMGASLNASIPFEHRLCAAGIDATVVESGELLHYPRPLGPESVVVVVSRSGESVEIARLLPRLYGDCTTIGITNEPTSTLARGADHFICVGSLTDEMVAIQTYSGTVLVLALVAAAAVDDLAAAEATAQDALDRYRRFIDREVEALTHWDEFLEPQTTVYLLARGPSMASAIEGALLFKETAKAPAASMAVASFRHGPVEIVDRTFRGLLFAPPDATRTLNLALASDLVRFGGRVRVIGPAEAESSDARWWCNLSPGLSWCTTPEVPPLLQPIVEIVPVQLAALRLAHLRGIVPGKFRFAPQVARDEAAFAPPD